MIRSSNFGLVYVDSKGTTSTPRRSLSNSESTNVQQSFHLSPPTSLPSRTFGSSNIANSANNNNQDSPTALSHRKTSFMKAEDDRDEDQAYPLCEDIGDLIADDSDLNQFDASDTNWMHKIDVTQFKDIQQDLFPSQMAKEEHLAEDDDAYNSSISMRENIPSTTSNRITNNVVYQRKNSSNIYTSAPRNSRWMKPSYSYSCLVALALKNSQNGQLTVSEIYDFMCENFPYFRTAPPGWKNSVRHNLSLNKCFQKIELYRPDGQGRKSCLWSLNPAKIEKMNQEVRKWRERDINNIKEALLCPDDLEAIEQGRKGIPIRSKQSKYSDDYRNNTMLRSNRPIYPRPTDQLQYQQHQQSLSFSEQTGYERLAQQPPLKQAKMHDLDRTLPTTSQFEEESDTMKPCGEAARRERVRSISVPQGGTLMIPEGCTVREVAAKNLQNLLENHSSRLSSYMTPVKNHSTPLTSSSLSNITNIQHSNTQPVKSEPSESSSLSATTTTTTFPQINQCVSPSFTSFTHHSPKSEKDTWYRTVLLSPLSPSPMTYSHNGTCAYDTVNSAINNNSLLKSALEQSPCRSLTFTSL